MDNLNGLFIDPDSKFYCFNVRVVLLVNWYARTKDIVKFS